MFFFFMCFIMKKPVFEELFFKICCFCIYVLKYGFWSIFSNIFVYREKIFVEGTQTLEGYRLESNINKNDLLIYWSCIILSIPSNGYISTKLLGKRIFRCKNELIESERNSKKGNGTMYNLPVQLSIILFYLTLF